MAGPASSLLPAQFLPVYSLTLLHPYPSQILTDTHRFPQFHPFLIPPNPPGLPSFHPYRSSPTLTNPPQIFTGPHFLSHLSITPLAFLLGPACHCGRSRLFPFSKSIYISLLSFTVPHKSSHILTFLFYSLGPACHCGRSRLPPSPSPLA